MRIAALFYIIVSVAANFWIGSLSTFVLAVFSFPLLVWLVVTKNPKKIRKTVVPNKDVNSPAAS